MVNVQSSILYVPFLFLTIFATVIASQALISGVFSIVYQGINTGAFPRMKVKFTSHAMKSQIYIGAVNFGLMIAVLFMLVYFKRSDKLASAYGVAVAGTMCITGILMAIMFYIRKKFVRAFLSIIITMIDVAFFSATLSKIEDGGYWSLVIAAFPFAAIMLWTKGQNKVYRNLRGLDIETFRPGYTQVYQKKNNIPGVALYFVGSPDYISPYIIHGIVRHGIIYERNILFSVKRTDYPHGIEFVRNDNFGEGLESFVVLAGYLEDIDIDKILKMSDINPKTIFYGIEDITTRNIAWKFFSVMKKLTPSFVKYYKIPGTKLIGVIYRVEI
jgi:KUP system potassium uptake protein